MFLQHYLTDHFPSQFLRRFDKFMHFPLVFHSNTLNKIHIRWPKWLESLLGLFFGWFKLKTKYVKKNQKFKRLTSLDFEYWKLFLIDWLIDNIDYKILIDDLSTHEMMSGDHWTVSVRSEDWCQPSEQPSSVSHHWPSLQPSHPQPQ